MKRILVATDFSSIGKNGGNIYIPIISSLAVEPVFVPLSFKISSFSNNFSCNLIDKLDCYSSFFNDNKIHFDSVIFSIPNYLDSFSTLDSFVTKCCFYDTFVILNDSNGKLASITKENYTWPYFKDVNMVITNLPKSKAVLSNSKDEIENYIKNITNGFTGTVIIPDFTVSDDKKAVIIYDSYINKNTWIYYKNYKTFINNSFFYELFGAVVSSSLMHELSKEDSCRTALRFMEILDAETISSKNFCFYGPAFEKKLPVLSELISKRQTV